MDNLEQQLLIKKLKDIVDKEFDSDLANLYPDPLSITALIEFQNIRSLKAISVTLKELLDEKEA